MKKNAYSIPNNMFNVWLLYASTKTRIKNHAKFFYFKCIMKLFHSLCNNTNNSYQGQLKYKLLMCLAWNLKITIAICCMLKMRSSLFLTARLTSPLGGRSTHMGVCTHRICLVYSHAEVSATSRVDSLPPWLSCRKKQPNFGAGHCGQEANEVPYSS